jgi:hypothetical protein
MTLKHLAPMLRFKVLEKDRHPRKTYLRCLQFNRPDGPASQRRSDASPSPCRNRGACRTGEEGPLAKGSTYVGDEGGGLGILYERVRSVGYDDGRAVAQPSRNVWLGVGDGDTQSLRQTLCRLYEAAPVDKRGRSCPVTEDGARSVEASDFPMGVLTGCSVLHLS